MESDGRPAPKKPAPRSEITRAVLPLIIERPRNRLRFGLGAAGILLILFLAVAVLVSTIGTKGETQSVPRSSASSSAAETPQGALYVHVTGAVLLPGLYVLRTGDRALDAVAAAGGFSPTADRAALNLARVLVDGEQIVVAETGAAAPAASGADSAGGGKVNLNTADETALETLPRVGPAMAKRIIEWRTKNGHFSTVEDLMSVTGVGEKTFADLKELITV